MKKILGAVLGMLLFVNPASAEIQTYDGEGVYIMSDFETPEIGKERAKARAERNAQEQAGVWVDSYLKVQNYMVVEDEVTVITGGIMSVENVQYFIEPINDEILSVRATLTAKIDSDQIPTWTNRTVEEKSNLVAENQKLLQANQAKEQQIEELKLQLKQVTTVEEKTELQIQITQEDQKLSAYQKIYDAHNMIIAGHYSDAVDLLTAAIELDPENTDGYFQRACAYAKLNQPRPMIKDLNVVIKHEPNNAIAYFDRGLAYKELGRLNYALEDFQKAVELDPNNQAARDEFAECYQIFQTYYQY